MQVQRCGNASFLAHNTHTHTHAPIQAFQSIFMSPQKVLAAPWYLVIRSRPSDKVTDTSSGYSHLKSLLKGEWKTTEGPRNQRHARGSQWERQLEQEENKPPCMQRAAARRGGVGLACFLPLEGHYLNLSGRFLTNLAALLESQSLHPGCQLWSYTPC